jgi:hypothetical protein
VSHFLPHHLSHFLSQNENRFFSQSPAFLKKLIQVSFSSNDKDFLVQVIIDFALSVDSPKYSFI